MTLDGRARAATFALIALVFGAGVLTGVAGDRIWSAEAPPSAVAGTPDGAGEEDREGRDEDRAGDREDEGRSDSRWLIHRVPLSEMQRAQVDSVLGFYRARVRELTDTYNEAYWNAVESTREELRGILRDDQRAHYDSLLADRDRRRGRD